MKINRPENENISISGGDAITILQEVELILISLHKIGSYYVGKNQQEYERETNRFIDEWKVAGRLAKVRTILSERFDSTLGEDDMDDLERAMEGLNIWTSPNDMP